MSKKLLSEDTKRSGLTPQDSTKLKLTYKTEQQTHTLTKKKCPSYTIPYFDINGRQTEYYRLRFLSPPAGFSSDKVKKFQRYWQPHGSSPQLYFPPLIKWSAIAKDISKTIVITEGEKKAAKACKEGLPCIGLGGVWSFKSKKLHKSLIDDFLNIDWNERQVWVIFDSDLRTNSKVLYAAYALAKELVRLGAVISIGFLPESDDNSKVGLDDYLLTNTIKDLEYIEMDDYELSKELWILNNELAVIKEMGSICRLETSKIYTKETIVGTVYADREIEYEVNNKQVRVNAVKEWVKWPYRKTYEALEYSPGREKDLSNGNLNTWKGWGCSPKKGSIAIWNKFLDYFFSNDKELITWFEQWLAYPLQNPGSKMFTSVLLHGIIEGTGKTFVGVIMSRIYGDNFSKIKQKHLFADHNEWAINKQFVLGEEITGSDKRHDMDDLKDLITGEKILVNPKFIQQYYIIDCINYLFTSNQPDAFFLGRYDRRIMVYEAPGYKWGMENYAVLDKWKEGAGPAALFHYLLHEVNCKKFNPLAEAPNTHAKQRMQDLSMSDVDLFISTIKEDPDSMLTHAGAAIDRDLFSAQEIVMLYDPEGSKRTTIIAITKALRRAGYEQLAVTKTLSGSKRLWPLRNAEKWKKASHALRVADYDRSVVFLEKARKAKFKGGKK